MNYWWLVANPAIWDFSKIAIGKEEDFSLKNGKGRYRNKHQNFLNAKAGDKTIGYEASPRQQITALLEVSKPQDGESLYFKKTETLVCPVDLDTLSDIPELDNMEFRKMPIGTLFKLSPEEYSRIIAAIRDQKPLSGSRGIVYILSNPAMPGIVKIGKTRNMKVRLDALYNTSVPLPFKCEFACEVDNYDNIEKAIFNICERTRVNPAREFFTIKPKQVTPTLENFNGFKDITGKVSQLLLELEEEPGK